MADAVAVLTPPSVDEMIVVASATLLADSMWRLLATMAEDDWVDAIDIPGVQVAVAEYCPDWWPATSGMSFTFRKERSLTVRSHRTVR